MQELTIINSKFRGQDAYSTSDLLIPHPTKTGRWKVIGRTDDQIMLSTGEKASSSSKFEKLSTIDTLYVQTNPVPLGKWIMLIGDFICAHFASESIFCQHPYVKLALMFGRGRFQNGVLIAPKKEYEFDPSDETKLADFRNSIWYDITSFVKSNPL